VKLPIPPGTQGVAGKQISAAAADDYLSSRLTKIAAIVHLTCIDFFADLPSAKKIALEHAAPTSLWPANTAAIHRPES
jgi:hypothetical protein